MTSKERAALRSQANEIKPVVTVGKDGLTETVFDSLEQAFNTRELVKIKVLIKAAAQTPREICGALCEKCGCEPVQVIGGTVVVWRYNKELHK